jgi:hypothetical protein
VTETYDLCQVCDPTRSADTWSNVADGTPCENGQLCRKGVCNSVRRADGSLCTPAGEQPDSTDSTSCCAGEWADPAKVCLCTFEGPCVSDVDCCRGTCQNGSCSHCGEVQIGPPLCSQASDCCSGNCQAGACAPNPLGGACGIDTDCESGRCAEHKCVVPSCVLAQQPCTLDSDCCTGNCVDRNGYKSCGWSGWGEPCLLDSDCVNDSVCVQGGCQLTHLFCSSVGFACSKPLDCCGYQSVSVPTQTCIAGLCALCMQVGQACGAADDCCNRNCQAGSCQCAPAGNRCSANFDCCSHDCAGGSCR